MIHTVLIVLIAAAAVFSLYYVAPWVLRQYRMNRIRNIVTRRRMLILTYDDGPSAELTPLLLDLLHARGAKATFFMQGQHAQRSPEIVDRVVREGHTIGCHSQRHMNAWKSWPNAAVADIDAGFRNLAPWIQSKPFFRPPHGKMTAVTYWWTRRRGVPVVWWTIDSGDTHNVLPTAQQIAETVRRDGGGIVLMHDISRGQRRNEYVLEVTAALLDTAESESLDILPLTEVPV